jgi:RNA polymerase sigma-70 factor (ECF subfamily)
MKIADSTFLQNFNEKNETAWNSFFSEMYIPLKNYAKKIVFQNQVAEDIVHDTLIKLWQNRIQFNSEKELISYSYVAVNNNSLNYLRKTGAEKSRIERWSFENNGDATSEQFSEVIFQEVIRKLKEIISQMPSERKKIVMMSLSGMKGEEIAESLNLSINTIKQQKYRAYKQIREQLTPYLNNSALSVIVAFLYYSKIS